MGYRNSYTVRTGLTATEAYTELTGQVLNYLAGTVQADFRTWASQASRDAGEEHLESLPTLGLSGDEAALVLDANDRKRALYGVLEAMRADDPGDDSAHPVVRRLRGAEAVLEEGQEPAQPLRVRQ